MNYLQTLEITTDLCNSNFDHYEQSYSEFSGVSIGNDTEGNYSKGIDWSQLQLPTNHTLKHLKIIYQMSKSKKQQANNMASSQPGTNSNFLHMMNLGSKQSNVVLYQSLIPGYDHSENQPVSTTQNSTQRQLQIGEELSNQSVKDLPRVEKISIYVNEIFKQVDFSSIER